MKTHVVILGAGFGGLELATRLLEILPDDVHVTLIDKNDYFIFGFSKFDVLFGRKRPDEIKSYYRDLAPGIDFRHEQIEFIDPATRLVRTDAAAYEADILVVALGAEMNPEATPGLIEGGHEFYTLEGVEKLRHVLLGFKSGVAMISILGLPYKCPPAPFEAALQLHDYLVARGVRHDIAIRVLSPAPTPLPVSKEGTETVLRLFAERNIEFLSGHLVSSIDSNGKRALLKERDAVPYDLFMAVPIHCVPNVVAASGLVEEGWIPVNKLNLETRFSNVFAVGDVTKIPVGAAAIPKAGAFADRAARTVAYEIAYRIRGSGSPGHFDGAGTCYLEFGAGTVAKIEANFLGGPAPEVRFLGPSREFRADKESFTSERITRWFPK